MALFSVPQRAGKAADNVIAKKSKTTAASVRTVKGGLLGRINEIVGTVERYLGSKKDDYVLIQDMDTLSVYVDACVRNSYISIDTETDGLDPLVNHLAGICIYTRGEKGAYIPLNHVSYVTGAKVSGQLPIDAVIGEFKRLIDNKPNIDMFNAKFDIRFLRAAGLKDIYCTWDGYLAARLMNENEPAALKKLHQKYILGGKEDEFRYDELFHGIPFTQIPLTTAYLYAAHDPVITTELCDFQRKYLREDSDRPDLVDLYHVFKGIEMACLPVVCDMEDNGVLLDMEYAGKLSEEYNKKLVAAERVFYDTCAQYARQIDAYKRKNPNHKLDDPISISSPTQIAVLLYDIIGVGVVDAKSPRGTGEAILRKIGLPITDAILGYREIQKLVSTYIDKLPACVNPKDGRIHCHFNQYGADTGRFSSSDPNLQNLPSHAKDIRPMFIASNDVIEVETVDNCFTVEKWCEVKTDCGWKYASSICVGDRLCINDNNDSSYVIVSDIKVMADGFKFYY